MHLVLLKYYVLKVLQKCPYYLILSRFNFCVCRLNLNAFCLYYRVSDSEFVC
jgi:hypothetical protein